MKAVRIVLILAGIVYLAKMTAEAVDAMDLS